MSVMHQASRGHGSKPQGAGGLCVLPLRAGEREHGDAQLDPWWCPASFAFLGEGFLIQI